MLHGAGQLERGLQRMSEFEELYAVAARITPPFSRRAVRVLEKFPIPPLASKLLT